MHAVLNLILDLSVHLYLRLNLLSRAFWTITEGHVSCSIMSSHGPVKERTTGDQEKDLGGVWRNRETIFESSVFKFILFSLEMQHVNGTFDPPSPR